MSGVVALVLVAQLVALVLIAVMAARFAPPRRRPPAVRRAPADGAAGKE